MQYKQITKILCYAITLTILPSSYACGINLSGANFSSAKHVQIGFGGNCSNISNSNFTITNFGPNSSIYQNTSDISLVNSILHLPIQWDGTATGFNAAPVYLSNDKGATVTTKNVAVTPYSNAKADPSVISNIHVASTPGKAIYSPFFIFLKGTDTTDNPVDSFIFAKNIQDSDTVAPTDDKDITIHKSTLQMITTTDGKKVYVQRVKLTDEEKAEIKKYAYVDETHKAIDYDYAYRLYIPCNPDHPELDCNANTASADATPALPLPGTIGQVLFLQGQNRGVWTHYQSYYDRALNTPIHKYQLQPHTLRLVYEHSKDIQLANLEWAWLAHTDQSQRHYWLTASAGHLGVPHHNLFRYQVMGAIQQQVDRLKGINYDIKIGLTGLDTPTMRVLPTATLEAWKTIHTQSELTFEPQLQVSAMANFRSEHQFHDITTRVGLRTYYKNFNTIINYRISHFTAGSFRNHSNSLEGVLNYNRSIRKNATFNAQVGYQQTLHQSKGV